MGRRRRRHRRRRHLEVQVDIQARKLFWEFSTSNLIHMKDIWTFMLSRQSALNGSLSEVFVSASVVLPLSG